MSQSGRLDAILAADVAGYSRLMGADEEGRRERAWAAPASAWPTAWLSEARRIQEAALVRSLL